MALIEAEVEKDKSYTPQILGLKLQVIEIYFFYQNRLRSIQISPRELSTHLPTEALAATNPTSLRCTPHVFSLRGI